MVCGACVMTPVIVASAFGASATAQRKVFLISIGVLFFALLIYYYYLSTCEQCSNEEDDEKKYDYDN